jgi:hypothetical protein
MVIDHHATKENILNAAKTEFALHGFSGARLAVIAENSGVNKALIHYYFQSKDLLYKNVWKSVFTWDEDFKNVPIFFDNVSFTITEKLYLYIYIVINLYIKLIDMEIINIFLWELAEGGNFLKSFKDECFSSADVVFNLILETGQKEGIFDLKWLGMITLGLGSTSLIYRVEQVRDTPKQFQHLKMSGENKDEKFLDYMIDYVFRMVTPSGKTIQIPEIKPEILEYIDKLLHMSSNKISIPISKRIMEFLMQ